MVWDHQACLNYISLLFSFLSTNQKHKNMSLTSFVCSLSSHKESHPKAKGTNMLKILEAMQMQCYDAMRDLRVKIGVLQMPLFKVILAGSEG